MLPLPNLRDRGRKWYRHWRNDVIGSGGYFIMKNWRKAFREGRFEDKLRNGRAKLEE